MKTLDRSSKCGSGVSRASGGRLSPHLGEATCAHGLAELSCAGLLWREQYTLYYRARREGTGGGRSGVKAKVRGLRPSSKKTVLR